ncbi:MAG: ATP-binding protein [Acidimicrobiales bacterium]
MSDRIELTIPARGDLLVLARLTAATLGTRAGFDIEDIEDLRLAVEELSLSVSTGSGALRLRFDVEAGCVAVECMEMPSTECPDGGATAQVDDGEPIAPHPAALSIQIIEALVDDYGREMTARGPRAWMVKRGAAVTS